MADYATGTLTRKVDDLVRAGGRVGGLEVDGVSRIYARIDEENAEHRYVAEESMSAIKTNPE